MRTLTADEQAQLDHDFQYHPPTGDQPERYQAINAAAKELVRTILATCAPCADRSAAIRQVREARMTANASIALERPA